METLLKDQNQTGISERDYPRYMANHAQTLGLACIELGRYLNDPRENKAWLICVNKNVELLRELTILKVKPPRHFKRQHKQYLKALSYIRKMLKVTDGLIEGADIRDKIKISGDAEKVAAQMAKALSMIAGGSK